MGSSFNDFTIGQINIDVSRSSDPGVSTCMYHAKLNQPRLTSYNSNCAKSNGRLLPMMKPNHSENLSRRKNGTGNGISSLGIEIAKKYGSKKVECEISLNGCHFSQLPPFRVHKISQPNEISF